MRFYKKYAKPAVRDTRPQHIRDEAATDAVIARRRGFRPNDYSDFDEIAAHNERLFIESYEAAVYEQPSDFDEIAAHNERLFIESYEAAVYEQPSDGL